MALDGTLKTLLAADATLAALLTGGIHTLADLGRLGIDRDTLTSLFDDGFLKPLCVVFPRDENAVAGIYDGAAKTVSTRQVVEMQLYDDGDAGFATLDSAAARIYALLHETRGVAGYRVVWGREQARRYSAVPRRACLERIEYDAYRVKGS